MTQQQSGQDSDDEGGFGRIDLDGFDGDNRLPAVATTEPSGSITVKPHATDRIAALRARILARQQASSNSSQPLT